MSDKLLSNGPIKRAVIATAAGDTALVAAVSGKVIRVLALSLVPAADATIRFESATAGTALTGQMLVAGKSHYHLPFNSAGWFETVVSELLNLEQAGTIAIAGVLIYQEVG